MPIKYGLRSRTFADKIINLSEFNPTEVLLFRSGTMEQTQKAIEKIREELPQTKITILVQADFNNYFPIDQEIIYPYSGSFRLSTENKSFFEDIAAANYPLVMVIYNNLAKRGYEAVEECALFSGPGPICGIYPDGIVVEIERNLPRKRELAKKIHQKIRGILNNA